MPETVLVDRFTIPRCTGKGFIVRKGQVLRVIEIEGKQIPDLAFFNAHNYKETYDAWQTYALNCIQGIGNLTKVGKFYSKPPWENVMFTVIDDKKGGHNVLIGGNCSRGIYGLRDKMPNHRSCSDNLADAVRPFGLGLEDIGDVFSAWMSIEFTEDGCFIIKRPATEKGDYLDLLAEMDCLVAVSACPSDRVATNDYQPKAIGIEIREEKSHSNETL